MNYEEYLERKRQELIKDMEKAGIEQLDYDSDVKTIIRDGNGNVLDIQMKEPGESFNSCRARNGLDMVNHPSHYKAKNGMEVIDVIEAFTANLEGYEATHTGNVIKYICRWKEKNGLEDLKKAQWYLNRLIENKEKEKEKINKKY